MNTDEKAIEKEVDSELNLYFIAKETGADIDTVRVWPYEKIYRWTYALKQISERKMQNVQHNTAFTQSKQRQFSRVIRRVGDQVIMT